MSAVESLPQLQSFLVTPISHASVAALFWIFEFDKK